MLVTDELVARMKPGTVLVDIAIDQGGCFEATRPTTHSDPTYTGRTSSVFYCVANMPGAVPHTSTYALTNVTLPYALELAEPRLAGRGRASAGAAPGVNVVGGQSSTGRSPRRTDCPGVPLDAGAVALTTVLSGPSGRAAGGRTGLPRPPGGRARRGGQHPGRYRRDLRRYLDAPRRRRPTSATSTEAEVAGFLAALRAGDDDHPPLSASSAARAVVAVRGLHRFAAREGLVRRRRGPRGAAAGAAARLPKALRSTRSSGCWRRPASTAPRWRCATGRCWRCSTAPAPGSPRRSGSTSTTST